MNNINAYDVSMMQDFFILEGMERKTGLPESEWNFMIFKELVDNALDAVEALPEKQIYIQYGKGTLAVYDNGSGISSEAITKSIYDFTIYHSSKRLYKTPSRGMQGNGLKTVICACYLKGYSLRWHTAEGKIISVELNAINTGLGENPGIEILEHGYTEKRGIEIAGIDYVPGVDGGVYQFHICNPDVTIQYNQTLYTPKMEPCNRSENTNISFYTLDQFIELVRRQDPKNTYKKFLQETFSKRVSDASSLTGKISAIEYNTSSFVDDFKRIQTAQTRKAFTALEKHMIGLKNHFSITEPDSRIPYVVEYDVRELTEKVEHLQCDCYANNSITYYDAWSVSFSGNNYSIGTRKTEYSSNLYELLEPYRDYHFRLHFICPNLKYKDTGKTTFDISGIIQFLCDSLKKAINKEHRHFTSTKEKPVSNRELMRKNLDTAFNMASDNGKYSITARQIFYKLREITGVSSNTYNDFTQEILTEWLTEHPKAEEKVFFSDRGNFYLDGKQVGLGTDSVKRLIDAEGTEQNAFRVSSGIDDNIYITPDFDIKYRYDKALYIEKTGFDGIFKAEGVQEKYNMIIVSGQGFGTRAAKTLLWYLQKKGIRLFCMHDLDYSGMNIINGLRNPNDKFEHPLSITDLGITLADVEQYGIIPEKVPADKKSMSVDRSKYTKQEQKFFFHDEYTARVELNAFTTAQILEIIDRKLSGVDCLPRVNIADVLHVDAEKIKETAFVRAMRDSFFYILDGIDVSDISMDAEQLTVQEAEERAPAIIENMIVKCEKDIVQILNKKINA